MAVGAMAAKGWNEAALTEACACLQRVLDFDADLALAAAMLSKFTALATTHGIFSATPDRQGRSARRARRALEIASTDSQVIGLAACALADLGEVDEGIDWLKLALALDPSNAQANISMGATQSKPFYPHPTMSAAHHALGHADEARHALERAVALWPPLDGAGVPRWAGPR